MDLAERDRRWSAVQAAMRADGLDALIVGMTDARGQKGGFRYLSDERPFHRYGYVLMLAGREPVLLLHPVLAHAPRGAWIKDVRFPGHAGTEMAAMLSAAGAVRVGLVGADQTMRISDHQALAALPAIDLVNADALFERVRGPKSAAEIAGLQEASDIADRCFGHLLDIARPDMTERDISGKLSDVAIAAGADELLFLTLSGEWRDAHIEARIRAPGDHVLDPAKPFVFSIELSGPSGFWVELARVLAFNGAVADVCETADLATRSVLAARAMIRDGVSGPDIQSALESPFDAETQRVWNGSGHAIGHDVIEAPIIAHGADTAVRFRNGMAFAMHPLFTWTDRPMAGYVADTYVLEPDGCRPLSSWALALYALNR
jgi:Xaa-Pro aminopeptidase